MSRSASVIKSLEVQLQKQLQLAQQLEAENVQLQQREEALMLTLATLHAGLHALQSSQQVPQPHSRSTGLAGQSGGAATCSGGSETASGQSSGDAVCVSPAVEGPFDSSCSSGGALVAPADGSPAFSSHDCAGVQQQQQQQEEQDLAVTGLFEGAMGQTPNDSIMAILKTLAASPERVASYLRQSHEERTQWLSAAIRRLALLLPKYNKLPDSTADLDAIVDEMKHQAMTYFWLDPEPATLVQVNLINMETGQLETRHPEGWWSFVAKSSGLNHQQKCSLRALWCRVKSVKTPLLQQHEALLQELALHQEQQHLQQQLFAQQAQQLPINWLCEVLAKHSTSDEPSDQQQQQPRPPSGVLLEPPLHQEPAAEVLLPPSSAAQQQLEGKLSLLREQLNLQERLLVTLFWNILNPRQMARLLVAAWPYCPDAFGLCEAFEEMGW